MKWHPSPSYTYYANCKQVLSEQPQGIHDISHYLLLRTQYDILSESSTVDPASLHPAEKLQWNISSETAQDIETAKRNIDRYILKENDRCCDMLINCVNDM